MLAYLAQKSKPLTYIETHAGRAIYDLSAPEAVRTGEAAQGIARALAGGWFAPDHPYAQAVASVRGWYGAAAYPGSPLLAAMAARPGDTMHLAELHPQEHAALAETMAQYPARCHRQDGFAMASAITPPVPRRGLMLVDPSYEVKADYQTIPRFLQGIHRKWGVGVLMLWYPLLADRRHAAMLAELTALFPGALRDEIGFGAARSGHGLTGSGLFVVNPPFGLADQAAALAVRLSGG